jgi:hypothetical protein
MNTRRNGFISAIAICYNYHCPLVLDPNDIWLVILQGFRVHLMYRHDAEYIKNTFKDLNKIGASSDKFFKLNEASLGDVANWSDQKLEELLFGHLHKVCKTMWTKKHKSDGFGAENNAIDEKKAGVMPTKELTDIFTYERSGHDYET